MGNSVSRVVCCFVPKSQHDAVAALFTDPLDEGLGHSFCYVRPVVDSLDDLSPGEAGDAEFNHDSSSIGSDNQGQDPLQQQLQQQQESGTEKPKSISETSFKSISGASVSANTAAPRSIVYHEQFNNCFANERAATFESTPSFSALPLQPIPRGVSFSGPMSGPLSGPCSGPLERGGFVSGSGPLERGFMSGPIERGFMSGPLDRAYNSGPFEPVDRTTFSAPLAVPMSAYMRKRRKSLARIMKTVGDPVKKALTRTVSNLTRTNRSVVAPMKSFASRETRTGNGDERRDLRSFLDSPQSNGEFSDADGIESHNLHWAQGKAGEDRVHVVLSEEHGWLFVGIYDGFSGPDATDYLMSNLYPAIYRELKGLLWDQKKAFQLPPRHRRPTSKVDHNLAERKLEAPGEQKEEENENHATSNGDDDHLQRVDSRGLSQAKVSDLGAEIRRWDAHNGSVNGIDVNELDCERFGCKAGDGCGSLCQRNEDGGTKPNGTAGQANGPAGDHHAATVKPINMRSLSTRFRKVYNRRKRMNQRRILQYRYEWEQERIKSEKEREEQRQRLHGRGAVNHAAVLKALARALEATEESYLDMIDEMFEENPELALIGSCVLVMLMKDEDVYILNVGDSRAVLAQHRKAVTFESSARQRPGSQDLELERIVEETPMELAAFEAHGAGDDAAGPPPVSATLGALQLSLDHSTRVPEEAGKIRSAHPDDTSSIVNDRVKGKLAVTRAFGAGYLKQPKWNDTLLEVFRVQFVGSAPYISCIPHLHHHKLCPQDQFLVLSSDGLYQYLTNDEVVSYVEWFMDKFPDGDPAQYLIEEVLFRAARKAGMEFHDLLDIPQGDRRKYHDDLSVMVVSLEGRIWRSSSR
ncbi:probable protein phosphatase 2C 23 [Selaginella moellendorffii]|uniref:probable protein phosphatase 2C 23 n=1 Tax=Selaginella moellendorffii TaxID=88036 RepID=UPI000D1C6733|nr:probable protein phosphatase 2C 23 [Selaginella moellendorffii]|eukprot:XP_024515451.1 probable protein phosphatase 2C 23 [Selaginella moellendorffii]